jgi:hypothetical protein
VGCSRGCSSAINIYYVPTGDHIPSGKVLKHHPRQRSDIQGIQLDQVPRLDNLIVLGLAHRIRSFKYPSAGRDMVPHRLSEHSTVLEAT